MFRNHDYTRNVKLYWIRRPDCLAVSLFLALDGFKSLTYLEETNVAYVHLK